MAKTKDKLKAKAYQHRALSVGLAKDEANTFVKTDFIATKALDLAGAPDPFTFEITMAIVEGITIKSVNIEGNIAQEDDFEIGDTNIVCTLDAFIGSFTFLLVIMAEGTSGLETTFTMTCDDKAVFTKAQKIKILGTGRGGFANPDVKLP